MFVLKRRKVRLMGVAFSPDGARVAAVGDRGSVLVWDLATKTLEADAPTGPTMNRSVAFLDETRLAVGNGCDLLTRDLRGEATWAKVPLPKTGGASWPAVSPDRSAISRAGDTLELFTLADPPALVWRKARPRVHYQLSPHAWSPCGRFLIEPNPDNTLTLRDARTGEPAGSFGEASGPAVTTVAVSPEGRVAAWAASTHLNVQRSGGFHEHYRFGKTHFLALAFHPTAPLLATANGDGKIDLWDTAAGKRRESFDWSSDRLNDVTFDAAGDRGACCSNAGEVVVWDVDP